MRLGSEWKWLFAAEAALLTGAVGVARPGGVGGVGPFALNLPLDAVAETDERSTESPSALVAVLGTR